MNWITEKVLPKFKAFVSKKETDEILWIKCKSCSQMIFHKEYSKNLNVCMSCGFHGYIDANSRLNYLCDENTIEMIKINSIEEDPLNFKDLKKYKERIKLTKSKTNLDEAITCAFGKINNIPCILACFDFAFMI